MILILPSRRIQPSSRFNFRLLITFAFLCGSLAFFAVNLFFALKKNETAKDAKDPQRTAKDSLNLVYKL